MKKRVQVFIAAGILAFTSCAPANEIAFINENKSFAIFHRTSERVILGHGGNVFYRPIDLYRVNFKNPGQNKYDYKERLPFSKPTGGQRNGLQLQRQ